MREAFIKKKAERSDKIMEEAQRLVNLYRHSKSFPADFHAELDLKLLHSSPEVQASLSRIVGGTEVRNYLEFLKESNTTFTVSNTEENEEGEKQISINGYLPEPSEDLPVFSADGSTNITEPSGNLNLETIIKGLTETRQAELENLLKVQTETLVQLLEKIDQKRQEVAGQQTERLINAIHQEATEQKKYSDIIETPETLHSSHETEGF